LWSQTPNGESHSYIDSSADARDSADDNIKAEEKAKATAKEKTKQSKMPGGSLALGKQKTFPIFRATA
jgi:hypothetical protein